MVVVARDGPSPCRAWNPSMTLLLGLSLDPIRAKVAETGDQLAL